MKKFFLILMVAALLPGFAQASEDKETEEKAPEANEAVEPKPEGVAEAGAIDNAAAESADSETEQKMPEPVVLPIKAATDLKSFDFPGDAGGVVGLAFKGSEEAAKGMTYNIYVGLNQKDPAFFKAASLAATASSGLVKNAPKEFKAQAYPEDYHFAKLNIAALIPVEMVFSQRMLTAAFKMRLAEAKNHYETALKIGLKDELFDLVSFGIFYAIFFGEKSEELKSVLTSYSAENFDLKGFKEKLEVTGALNKRSLNILAGRLASRSAEDAVKFLAMLLNEDLKALAEKSNGRLLESAKKAELEAIRADLKNGEFLVKVEIVDGERKAELIGEVSTTENFFNTKRTGNVFFSLLFCSLIYAFINIARKNPNLYLRRIGGLDAVDDAIGRCTEMGKPTLFVHGLSPMSHPATIAAVNILGQISKKVAEYGTSIKCTNCDPVVLGVSQEVVEEAFLSEGRPDAYQKDSVVFMAADQFSYVAAINGMMVRDKPAANFYMGHFYAESLLLSETGSSTGAIQIAGTDSYTQLPFFITTCDYTLMGEELYAASAYLSREPVLLGSLKGQDWSKAIVIIILLAGTITMSFGMDFIKTFLVG